MRIWDLPKTEQDAILFFQERNILPKKRKCTNSHDMKLYFGKRKFWKCNLRQCDQQVGLRKDNWFEGSRIPFCSALRFIYCWCEELTSIKFCEKQLDLSDKTVIDWNNYMRELCVLDMETKPNKKVGGPDCIVEIDESLFTKRKNNCGRVLPEQWVFGGICRETKDSFVVTVPNRTGSTLLDKIIENIADGSTIYSDSWKGYQTNRTEIEGFLHAKVNHKYNFIDPDTGVPTQTVERMWGSAKWRNKRHRGTARHHLESYLSEFIWRQHQVKENRDCFESMLNSISAHFPPKSD